MSMKETMEVVEYIQSVADSLLVAKTKDGEVSTRDLIVIALNSSSSALDAFSGIGDIDDEFSKMTPEEKEILLKSLVKILATFGHVLGNTKQVKAL